MAGGAAGVGDTRHVNYRALVGCLVVVGGANVIFVIDFQRHVVGGACRCGACRCHGNVLDSHPVGMVAIVGCGVNLHRCGIGLGDGVGDNEVVAVGVVAAHHQLRQTVDGGVLANNPSGDVLVIF